MSTLTSADMEVLEFARVSLRWKPATKESLVLQRFSYMLPRFQQRLNHVIDLPEAEAYDAALVRTLRRLRAARQANRSARREGWNV